MILRLELDGGRRDNGKYSSGWRLFRLTYQGVRSVPSGQPATPATTSNPLWHRNLFPSLFLRPREGEAAGGEVVVEETPDRAAAGQLHQK